MTSITAVAEQVAPVTAPTTPTDTPSFETFSSTAPKELQELFTKNGVKDFDTLSKSYSGLNSMLGKKGLVKPAEGAPEEEVKAYNDKLYNEYLNVPADGKYEYKIPETIPQEAVSQEFIDSLAATAKEIGIGKDKFQKVIDVIYDAYGKMLATQETPSLDTLQKEWGKDVEKNTQEAHAFYKNYMANDPAGQAAAERFGNDPDFLRFVHNMSKSLKEDKLSTPESQKLTSDDMKRNAVEKTRIAMEARAKGDYALSEKLQKEAQELYAQAI